MSGRGGRGRRGGHEEAHEEGSERWLVTYADMLTLLMVLFVVLYAISSVDSKKYMQLSTSLASAFNGGQNTPFEGTQGLQDGGGSSINPQLAQQQVAAGVTEDLPRSPQDTTPVTTASASASASGTAAGGGPAPQDFNPLAQQIGRALDAKGLGGGVRITVDQRGLVVSVVTSDLVFGGNSAELLGGGQQILDVVAPMVAGLPNAVEVDGHTNQLNVSTYPWASGWELSSARASAVVRYLAGHGVAENRLSAVGRSDQDPLYPADDPRSVTLNRRVDIVVLNPGGSPTSPAAAPAR